MRFDIISLFPEIFTNFLEFGVTSRAFKTQKIKIKLWNPRDYSTGNYRRIDDRPFGGGPGMVMQAEPLKKCLDSIFKNHQNNKIPVIFFTPTGKVLNQNLIENWSKTEKSSILICGRYEGIDQRFIDSYVTHEISLGDFILSGGELPALTFLDSIARLQPEILNNEKSFQQESFNNSGLLDYPNFTRPEIWQGQKVPEVLLSGNHKKIDEWRLEQQLLITKKKRPDLIRKSTK